MSINAQCTDCHNDDMITGDVNYIEKFNQYWNMNGPFIEPPNKRRGGWSGVQVMEYSTSKSQKIKVCVKKQENHYRHSLLHPFKGMLTIENEARNLLYCHRNNVPVSSLVYWGKAKIEGKDRAILSTVFLKEFIPLNDLIDKWTDKSVETDIKKKKKIVKNIAQEVKKLHDIKLVHNSLYPKHIFINPETSEVCFIDLEKSKRRLFRSRCVRRDLDTLNRHTTTISKTDKLRFLLEYCKGVHKRDSVIRAIWQKLSMLMDRH